ncbi:uncharacterized protein LOC117498085 isoform X2 [Trematomus bernacchii]|uniref:uncharacterized protein LOC117498085 isoform X2 n=1 Tax=Trematomus bernacchii TaxID=40690 RepID=UPI00146C40E2|nr:uncharacterized protein LOC117498085 isoform X2 [Trematomus bernacchii]
MLRSNCCFYKCGVSALFMCVTSKDNQHIRQEHADLPLRMVQRHHLPGIHQGKMGCALKGMSIPESEQFRFKGYKYTNADSGPSIKIDKTLTPPQHSKTHQNTNNVRRALDFSTGAQQVEQLYWELPTTSIAFQLKERERERETEKEMEKEREAQKLQKMRQDIRANLQQKIQAREQKISKVTSSVKDCMGGLDAEWLEINSVFSEVVKVVEDSRQEALQPLEERIQRVSREGKDLVKKLQNEIDKIFKTIDEWEENGDWQGLPKTGLDESRDWKNVTVDTSFSFGSLRTTISSMMEQIHQELEKLSSVGAPFTDRQGRQELGPEGGPQRRTQEDSHLCSGCKAGPNHSPPVPCASPRWKDS